MNNIFQVWLNGTLIPLNLFIIGMIARSLWKTRQRVGHNWTRVPGVQSAGALIWIFIADLLRACTTWLILHTDQDFQWYVSLSYILSGIILIVATLRLIYTLSPASWGHKSWVASAFFILIFFLCLNWFWSLWK